MILFRISCFVFRILFVGSRATSDEFALYNCRDSSTTVMDSLQIRLFMQNKANFRKSQMNVNNVLTKNYEKKTLGQRGKTKPIKANQSQSKPIKANKMLKQSQTSKRQKPMQTSLPQRIMKKTALLASDKTKPNKPNQTQLVLRSLWRSRIKTNFKGKKSTWGVENC